MSCYQIEHLTIRCDATQAINDKNSSIDNANEIEVEIIPHSSGKNIAQINGNYHGLKCTLDRSDLHGLPLQIKGTGGTLSEKVSLHLNGKQDKKGEFNLFLTCMCTTLVKFQLWGEVFPNVDAPVEKISADVLRDEVFRKLRNSDYSKHKDKAVTEWVSGMNSFWDRWHKWFKNDVSKEELFENLDSLNQTVKKQSEELSSQRKLLERQSEEIMRLSNKVTELQQYLNDLQKQLTTKSNTSNGDYNKKLETRLEQLEQILNCTRRVPNVKF